MSEVNIEPIGCKSFVWRGADITPAGVNFALRTLYMQYDFNPTFIMLSSQRREDGLSDYAQFLDMRGGNIHIRSSLPEVIMSSASTYLNQMTGQVTSICAAYHLLPGYVVFGRLAIDEDDIHE